jgi:Fe-S-cluster containining protein
MPMKFSLRTIDGISHSFDIPTLEDPDCETLEIPCFRCGVCCERWQPLIDMNTARRIAGWLGKPLPQFIDEHTDMYPLHDEQRLIRRTETGACSFLQRDAHGKTGCRIHPVRPDACRDWQAGLEKKECKQGCNGLGMVTGFSRFPPSMKRIRTPTSSSMQF